MTIAVLLAGLAWVDCLLCGMRVVVGTEGRIHKRAYYVAAVVRASGAGLASVGALAAFTGLLVSTAPETATSWRSFVAAGRVCVVVFGAFASATFAAFGFYFSPACDFRVLSNVLVFGPLTLARPYVIAAGLAAGAYAAADLRVSVLALVAGTVMLSFQPLLGRRYRGRWQRLVARPPTGL